MGTKRLKIPILKFCRICQNTFGAWYITTQTCSKGCKNLFASQISQSQFKTQEAKEKHQSLMKEVMSDPEIRAKFDNGMRKRRSYQGSNHPRWGAVLTPETKQKIGNANRGRFKDKTWEEMYGKEVASLRRAENATCMATTNALLMSERTSKAEREMLKVYGPIGFGQNKRVGKYTVDFLKESSKEIVEYNGDYWHCNPKLYAPDFYNKSIQMLAKDKWEYDKKRIAYLENLGYSVKIIWENEIHKMGY